jgi:hypothetical protein
VAARARVGARVFFPRPLWDFVEPFEKVHPWSTAVRVEQLVNVPFVVALGIGATDALARPASCGS